jgi:hypothetical protein
MENNANWFRRLPLVLQGILQTLWVLICLVMVMSAIIGLGCVILGLLSLFVDLSGFLEMQLGGEPVRTTTQKVQFVVVGTVVASTGIGFWWLSRRGYVVGSLICYAILVAIFLAIAWATGRADVISVGGAKR